jgi:hypothetical protein
VLGYQSNEFQHPQAGHLLAPWVAIDFVDTALRPSNQGASSAITVSNLSSESTDPSNCAVIKSFSCGHADGMDVRVVIHDTHGGNFEEFMRHLLTDWNCTIINSAQVVMRVQFGWVKSGCKEPIPSSRSPCYYVVCRSIETNYSEGKFIFEITGKDLGTIMPEGSAEWNKGGQGVEGVYFLDAVTEFMTSSTSPGPNVNRVIFEINNVQYPFSSSDPRRPEINLFKIKGGTEDEQKFGKKGSWQSHGKNKIEAVKKWAIDNPSVNEKPWNIKYDPTVLGGAFLFQEVLDESDCFDKNDEFFDSNSLGTYIVNGGPMSPVVEFNPKINWNFAMMTGGAAGLMGDRNANPTQLEGSKNPGAKCLPKSEDNKGAGQATSTSTSDNQHEQGDDSQKDDAERKASEAIISPIAFHSISADLVIVGNPNFCPPRNSMRKFISIVLINPFHIAKEGGGPNGDWYLASQSCNHVLSNKGWIIMAVTHQIDAGKFTTTINVKLPAPGADYAKDRSLGGWNKGWKPPKCI